MTDDVDAKLRGEVYRREGGLTSAIHVGYICPDPYGTAPWASSVRQDTDKNLKPETP